MGDDHEGLTLFPVQVAHEREHIRGRLGVQVAGGLVGPDDRGLAGQRPRNGNPLALSAGEFRRAMLRPIGQSHLGQAAQSTLPGLPRADAAEQEGKFDVLHRRDDGEQVEGLEHEAHASGPIAGARPVAHRPQRGAFDFYLSLIEAVQAGKAVDQCRLAAPRWPHHGHHLAGGDGQIHAAQGMHLDLAVAEGFVYVSSQDDWFFHGTTPLHTSTPRWARD